ncbi:MAG: YitT family protein [Faecalibacillus sp.]
MEKNKRDLLIILLGNTLLALAVTLFIVPGKLITGGTTGIALFLNHYFHLPISFFTFIFNFIMFVIGAIVLGKRFALTTLLSTFYYPIILGVFEIIFKDVLIIDDILINTLFSGVLLGISIAIVIKAGASTGGMDIPPLILHKKYKIPVSVSMYLFDTLIVFMQLAFSDIKQLMYGIVMICIYSIVIDKISIIGEQKIEIKIVSEHCTKIKEAIIQDIDRGVTLLHGQTGYFGIETDILVSVVSHRELSKVEKLIKSIDPEAFMIIARVNEVHGHGFTLEKDYLKK